LPPDGCEFRQAASVLGRIVNVGRLGGMKGEFDFELHAMKRIDYIGVTFRTKARGKARDANYLAVARFHAGVRRRTASHRIYIFEGANGPMAGTKCWRGVMMSAAHNTTPLVDNPAA
jgi:hypothetical protein